VYTIENLEININEENKGVRSQHLT